MVKVKENNKIALINGPNLNLLGQREVSHYGVDTLNSIVTMMKKKLLNTGFELLDFQSNHEGVLIDYIQENMVSFIIINPAAYTHTSIAIKDALLAVNIPYVEVHLSNIYAREAMRKHSYFSDSAVGVISGLGKFVYLYALDFAVQYLNSYQN